MSQHPMPAVAFQGEYGSNSHLACQQACPHLTPLPCATFQEALAAVTVGRAVQALLPVDNTLAGRVADIHHLLPRSGLHIVGEFFLPVHFQLMALPGATLSGLRTVHSHIHALGQCRKLLQQHNLTPVVASDTAGAAREIAESKDKAADLTRAALAPRLAAQLYGLTILAEDVEDEAHNTTRFLHLAPTPLNPDATSTQPFITSLLFRVGNQAGALHQALGCFARHQVNLTKLESYLADGAFHPTMFHADAEGHPQASALQQALNELAACTSAITLLGTYPAHPHRRS